jgi:hypothetical protein
MSEKSKTLKPAQRGMVVLKVTIPKERAEELRQQATDEGIALQAYLAPILNSIAKREIRREYVVATAA